MARTLSPNEKLEPTPLRALRRLLSAFHTNMKKHENMNDHYEKLASGLASYSKQ